MGIRRTRRAVGMRETGNEESIAVESAVAVVSSSFGGYTATTPVSNESGSFAVAWIGARFSIRLVLGLLRISFGIGGGGGALYGMGPSGSGGFSGTWITFGGGGTGGSGGRFPGRSAWYCEGKCVC